MDGYLHTPAEIATALRAVADDLAAVDSATLPDILVAVNIQVAGLKAPDGDRAAAVDLLARAMLGVPGQPHQAPNGSWLHAAPYERRHRDADRVNISVYTAIAPPDTASD